jgi:hypothetical protein
VTVQRDILAHARLLSFPKRVSTARLTPAAGVALSYFHSERSEESAFSPSILALSQNNNDFAPLKKPQDKRLSKPYSKTFWLTTDSL